MYTRHPLAQVQSASDIENLRNFLDDCGGENIGIIAKIETLGGLTSFDDILGEVRGWCIGWLHWIELCCKGCWKGCWWVWIRGSAWVPWVPQGQGTRHW